MHSFHPGSYQKNNQDPRELFDLKSPNITATYQIYPSHQLQPVLSTCLVCSRWHNYRLRKFLEWNRRKAFANEPKISLGGPVEPSTTTSEDSLCELDPLLQKFPAPPLPLNCCKRRVWPARTGCQTKVMLLSLLARP